MKLISCQIAGFGKFTNRAFDLSAPVVVCKQDNGWGKTTLATFLECMFYGMDGGRSKQIPDNTRIKYEPWQGGSFGGSLTFEYKNKTYRVERFFGKTAGGDISRVFDANNMLCYDFGDKAERLGETLFGVDRDSYRRVAYIRQGENGVNAVTEDIRAKLIAILSTEQTGTGAQIALDKLDNAERALKAKRKPAKGKLDEIEEKIAYLYAQQADCLRAREQAQLERAQYESNVVRLRGVTDESQKLGAMTEEYARRGEMAANRAAKQEIEEKLQDSQTEMARWQQFFNGIEPSSINVDGLERAVCDYYACQEKITQTETNLQAFGETETKRQLLQTQIVASKQTLDGYERLLDAAAKAAEKTDKREKEAKTYSEKKRKRGRWITMLGFVIAVLGAVFSATSSVLGAILLIVGGVGIVFGIAQMYRHTKGYSKPKKRDFTDPALQAEYEAEQARLESLEEQLSALDVTGYETQSQTLAALRGQRQSLGQAIEGFLANFRVGEVYDYRVALAQIKEGKERCARNAIVVAECSQRLSAFSNIPCGEEPSFDAQDMQTLSFRKGDLEREKEKLHQECARANAALERLESRALSWNDYAVELQELEKEKQRLERRLLAVRTAKELLLKARANMASRYLEPVERACRKYASFMGLDEGSALRFSGDGTPIVEDGAAYRATAYYSGGMQELLDFCVRLALAECLFAGRSPVLILDDPFTNLDDDKTKKAKALVSQLSKQYQILYFTCKEERAL